MMLLTMWTAPFNFGVREFGVVEGKELRKMLLARDRALDSDKLEVLLCTWRHILLAWKWTVALG
jgi:hypothetical protein